MDYLLSHVLLWWKAEALMQKELVHLFEGGRSDCKYCGVEQFDDSVASLVSPTT